MKTVVPADYPVDFNTWIKYIYKQIYFYDLNFRNEKPKHLSEGKTIDCFGVEVKKGS